MKKVLTSSESRGTMAFNDAGMKPTQSGENIVHCISQEVADLLEDACPNCDSREFVREWESGLSLYLLDTTGDKNDRIVAAIDRNAAVELVSDFARENLAKQIPDDVDLDDYTDAEVLGALGWEVNLLLVGAM